VKSSACKLSVAFTFDPRVFEEEINGINQQVVDSNKRFGECHARGRLLTRDASRRELCWRLTDPRLILCIDQLLLLAFKPILCARHGAQGVAPASHDQVSGGDPARAHGRRQYQQRSHGSLQRRDRLRALLYPPQRVAHGCPSATYLTRSECKSYEVIASPHLFAVC